MPETRYRNEIANNEFNEPNIAWAGDFTSIKYKGSFIYLAMIIDVCTREIIGSAISKWHKGHLVKSALLEAIKKRGCLVLRNFLLEDEDNTRQLTHFLVFINIY